MGWPVVISQNGYGLPVTESDSPYAIPVEIADNGYGMPVVVTESGGLPVTGIQSTPVVEAGGLLSLTIRDDTPMDPDGGGIGPDGNGWVAEVVLKDLTSTAGTIDATKLTLTVTDPGFDAAGDPTTVERTIVGMTWVRRQYPNGGSKQISSDGTDLTILIALSDVIYAGSTVTAASIATGFYTSSVASDAASITNNSTETYKAPVLAWLNTQLTATSSNTHPVETAVFHRHATNGRQVAAVKYTAKDGTHTGTPSLVTSTSLSAIQTTGNIAEVYAATIDCSTMDQGAVFEVDVDIYPWIGTAYNLKASGYQWPTTLPQTPLRLLSDRTGAYSGGFAYASPGGNDGTGVASGVAATARAAPFATPGAAATALQSWINTNKGHNNLGGGTLRLMDNAGADYVWDGQNVSGTIGLTWFHVEKDPLATGNVTLTNFSQYPGRTHYKNLRFDAGFCCLGPDNTPASQTSDDRTMAWLDTCSFIGTGDPTWYNIYYHTNNTFTGAVKFANLSADYDGVALLLGGTATSELIDLKLANVVIGLNFQQPGDYTIQANTSTSLADGGKTVVIYNNKLVSMGIVRGSETAVDALVVVQNLFEQDAVYTNVACNLLADGDLTTCDNVIDMMNTGVGERCSKMYADTATVAPKKGVSKGNIWDNYNNKADTYLSGAGSVGNWAYHYSVGNEFNVSLFGVVDRTNTAAPHNDNSDTPYMGSAWHPSSEYNVQRHGLSKDQVMALFTDYTVGPEAVPAVGGDYHPVNGAAHITSRIPAGRGMLKYDIDGATRATDGSGAAGAYEQAS